MILVSFLCSLFAKKKQRPATNVLQTDIFTDVKEEQIVREKQLCSDYEERMADQVGVCNPHLICDQDEDSSTYV